VNHAAKRELTEGERHRLRAAWVDGYLTRVQLCARFCLSEKRLREECAGLSRQMEQSDPRRQAPRVARALL